MATALALVVFWGGAAATAARAADPVKRERLMLVRTTPGPASYDFDSAVEIGEGGGFIGYVFARYRNGVVDAVFPGGQVSFGRHADGVYVFGESITGCDVGSFCPVAPVGATGLGMSDPDAGDPEGYNVVFIVLEGSHLAYGLDQASGWVLRKASFDYRYVDATEAQTVSAGESTYHGQVLLEAGAAGGTTGSIAQASPPCSTAGGAGVGRGVGQITLDGGANSPTRMCPTAQGTGALADFSHGATDWLVHGVAAGDATLRDAPLWVVDLPAKDPTQVEEDGSPDNNG